VRHAEFYADVPMKRAFAWIVDTVLVTLMVIIIVPFTAFTAVFFLPLLWLSVGFLYRWASIAKHSATPGMRLMSVILLDRDGTRLDGATAFMHTLGYSVSMAFVLPQVVSVALMLFSRRGQGLTDMILGTVAINRAARV
jgi:uncharacterized RDD family membrane protein YckC